MDKTAAQRSFLHVCSTLDKDDGLDQQGFCQLLKALKHPGNQDEHTAIFDEFVALVGATNGVVSPSHFAKLYETPTYKASESVDSTSSELVHTLWSLYLKHSKQELPSDINPHTNPQAKFESDLAKPKSGQAMVAIDIAKAILSDTEASGALHTSRVHEELDQLTERASSPPARASPTTQMQSENTPPPSSRAATLTFSEFISLVLRHQVCKSAHQIPASIKFPRVLLDPALHSEEEFVAALESWVINHDANTHWLLTSLGCGGFPNPPAVLLNLMIQYQKFSGQFFKYVQGLTTLLGTDTDSVERVFSNLEEECGNYDDETLQHCKEQLGLDPESILHVPHSQLFERAKQALLGMCGTAVLDKDGPDLGSQLRDAFEQCCFPDSPNATVATAVGALNFGSELIVPELYRKLLMVLQHHTDLSMHDIAFFPLHIDVDVEHAAELRIVSLKYARTEAGRQQMLFGAQLVMETRKRFYSEFAHRTAQLHTQKLSNAASLYNSQSTNWSRTGQTCLSDFTGRPRVFEACEPFIRNAKVLDLGCGEGYCARKFEEMGASQIIGIDISSGMIQRAKASASEANSTIQHFLVGDVTKTTELLVQHPEISQLLPGADMDLGWFDLVAAVFLFNYTDLTSTQTIIDQAFELLRPGGNFVFSVPHPLLPFLGGHSGSSFGFDMSELTSAGGRFSPRYFSLRDHEFPGTIKTIDGKELRVRMMFKTFEDYISMLRNAGFDLVSVVEAGVQAKHMALDKDFFGSVKDLPLHLVFHVRKPSESASQSVLSRDGMLGVLPRKLYLSLLDKSLGERALVLEIPDIVNKELCDAAIAVFEQGVDHDQLQIGVHIAVDRLLRVKAFGKQIRDKLLVQTGGAVLRKLNMNAFRDPTRASDDWHTDLDRVTKCSKIAYYILCSFVGVVDGGARGRLFDVRSTGAAPTADNVLFSVANTEAGWHTDGASRDRVYDVVGLLCINPAARGGEFKISNACNVLQELKKNIPAFLLYELFRPLPRDVLENGAGLGLADNLTHLSRSQEVLAMRILRNSYPIFTESQGGDHLGFRYMRYWIETGHQKANLPLSPLLRVAMDLLDQHLDAECCFNRSLEPGEIVFSNNLLLAHARESFEDTTDGSAPPRHKVRAWLQIQKAQQITATLARE